MYTTNLGGHSGCTVLLCENDDDNVFVRKLSGSHEYNERLKNQADKQKKFKSTILKTPKVLAEGFSEEGLYYFDMEYVQGITLAEKLKTIEIGKIRPVINNILDEILVENIAGQKTNSEASNVFQEKIVSLERNLIPTDNLIVTKALKILKEHDWSNISKTKCHGDMTFENIIIKDSQLYLIDFLDSFYDSWILDVSTLLQDSLVMWSYRKESRINNNTLVRLIIFKDILIDALNSRGNNFVLDAYYSLLLKLIRIYPYTTDELTLEFLDEKTNEIISIIQEREKVCVH